MVRGSLDFEDYRRNNTLLVLKETRVLFITLRIPWKLYLGKEEEGKETRCLCILPTTRMRREGKHAKHDLVYTTDTMVYVMIFQKDESCPSKFS